MYLISNLHAKTQPLKESREVTMESFSIGHTASQASVLKKCSQNIGGTYEKTPIQKSDFR